MNPWTLATVTLLPAVALAIVRTAHGPIAHRLAALQTATALATLVLTAMAIGSGEDSALDLAVMLTLLAYPATLLFAVFVERWL